MTNLLEKINDPKDLRELSSQQLKDLAQEIRDMITHRVSQTGGHLASNLGIVEMTIAMHYVFNFKTDHLLWDVGHQCYAHKIITARRDLFSKLRQRDGISGFPNPDESDYDRFTVGHAGTSIATAIGMALGAQANNCNEKIVAVVGDASIVNGTSFEALNNLGLVKRQLLIILNDNSMAIDVTQGAIAKFLSKVRLSHTYEDLRKTTSRILEHLPVIGKKVDHALENFKKTLRMAITPSRLFESLNVPYFGPVDGHDIPSLIQLFKAIEHLETPAILHVYTKKGKGFTPADDNPRKFHSTGPFEINGQQASMPEKKGRSFTSAFSDAIVDLAKNDDRIVAITAAMPDGTGLVDFRNQFPKRYYDVGIAESAAVDIAAGLAKKGFKPFVCIYSTFLQRSYDQIFQEVALQNLPVIFCIDRAGLVGSDGPTHHGLMDIGFTRMLPNMTVTSPATEEELKNAMLFAANHNGPVTIRYPRDFLPQETIDTKPCSAPFRMAESVTIKPTDPDITLIAFGSVLTQAVKAAKSLEDQNINVGLINARFAKPIDEKILSLIKTKKYIITIEDHSQAGGFGSALLEAASNIAQQPDAKIAHIITLAAPDKFINVDTRNAQLDKIGINADKIIEIVKQIL